MKPALLDVNVLIALLDPSHEFHNVAHVWFEQNRQHGWATCPITENACLRILSKPAYPWLSLSVPEIRLILAELCSSPDHLFWPDSISVLNDSRFDLSAAGPKQITDLYLVGIAVAQSGRLATFDRHIHWQSVAQSAPDTIDLLLFPVVH